MKKLFVLCLGFLLFFSTYAQAHTHITFAVAPMYPANVYQTRWMIHEMQIARMRQHILRAQLRNIRLQQQMERMNGFYPRTFYWTTLPCDGYVCMANIPVPKTVFFYKQV